MLFGEKIKLKFVGPMPTARDPKSFWINKARRGELLEALTPFEAGLLCTSTDDGDDSDEARRVEGLLRSWVAGGLLTLDAKGMLTPADLLKVKDRLAAGRAWHEGAQAWCGAVDASADHAENEQPVSKETIEHRFDKPAKDGKGYEWKSFFERYNAWPNRRKVGHGRYLLSDVLRFAAEVGYTVYERTQADPSAVIRHLIGR